MRYNFIYISSSITFCDLFVRDVISVREVICSLKPGEELKYDFNLVAMAFPLKVERGRYSSRTLFKENINNFKTRLRESYPNDLAEEILTEVKFIGKIHAPTTTKGAEKTYCLLSHNTIHQCEISRTWDLIEKQPLLRGFVTSPAAPQRRLLT